MDWFWKPIGAPLVVAAIVGLTAFYFGRATAPDLPSIRGEIRGVDIPNPLSAERLDVGSDIEKALLPIAKIPGLGDALDRFMLEPTLRISSVIFRNDSPVRTKEIELATDGKSAMLVKIGNRTSVTFDGQLKLRPIDPNNSTNVVLITSDWSPYLSQRIRAIHDSRKVDIRSADLPPEFTGYMQVLDDHPFLATFVMFAAGASLIVMLLAIPFGIANNFSMAFRAKMTTKAEVKKLSDFLEYVRVNHPDKVPA